MEHWPIEVEAIRSNVCSLATNFPCLSRRVKARCLAGIAALQIDVAALFETALTSAFEDCTLGKKVHSFDDVYDYDE